MTPALRQFYAILIGVTVLAAFVLALQIRTGDMGFSPLVVIAFPIGALAAYWMSPALADEQRLRVHAGRVAVAYLASLPLVALADILAVPGHVYLSALGVYLFFGLVMIPLAVLVGVFTSHWRGSGKRGRARLR